MEEDIAGPRPPGDLEVDIRLGFGTGHKQGYRIRQVVDDVASGLGVPREKALDLVIRALLLETPALHRLGVEFVELVLAGLEAKYSGMAGALAGTREGLLGHLDARLATVDRSGWPEDA